MDGEAESAEGGPDTPPNTPVTPSYKPPTCKDQRHWRDSDRLEILDSPESAACLGQQQHPHSHHHPDERHESHAHHHHHQHQHQHQHQHHHHHHHHHQHHQANPGHGQGQSQSHRYHHHQHQHQHQHQQQQHQHQQHQQQQQQQQQQQHHDKKSCSGSQGGCEGRASGDSSSMYSCYQTHWCAASTPSTPSPRHSPSPCSPSPSCSPSSSCSSDEELEQEPRRPRRRRLRQRRSRPPRPRTASPDRSQDGRCDDDPDDEDDDQAVSKLPNPGDLPTYITRFQWDMAKYPIKQSLRNIADIISKQVGQIDADLKTKSTTYNNLKGNLQNLEKKQTGSLLTRNLADLVKKEHFILDSEYLTTLLVIVPRASFQEWNTFYEKLTDMIVPRSSQLITQDHDYGLFTVTLFKKVIEEFKLHAREKKFIVRDFTYNEEELAAGKNEMTKLVTDKKKQFGPLVRWLKVNFSECFCAWIHVKALRVFVESVLRYGLPVNFQAILLRPHKKSTKRLRDVLNQLYAHLDSSATAGSSSANQDSVDIPGLGFGQSDYFPYVYYKINVDMVDSKV